ncbi:MAG: DJ-1/PfpI family protein [Bacteroidota bacterium]
MEKVLLVAGDAAESLEVMYPYQRLKEEGYEVHIAAPKKKVLQCVVHDFEPGFDTYTEKPGYRVPADVGFEEVDPAEYVGVIFAGGRAPEWIRNEKGMDKIVDHFFEKGKPVAAICHGPLILAAHDKVKGRTLTAYPVLKPDIEKAGGKFVDQEVVVDGNLVSSRAWPDHPAFMREFIKLLKEK